MPVLAKKSIRLTQAHIRFMLTCFSAWWLSCRVTSRNVLNTSMTGSSEWVTLVRQAGRFLWNSRYSLIELVILGRMGGTQASLVVWKVTFSASIVRTGLTEYTVIRLKSLLVVRWLSWTVEMFMFSVTTKGMATGLAAMLLELNVMVRNLPGIKVVSRKTSLQNSISSPGSVMLTSTCRKVKIRNRFMFVVIDRTSALSGTEGIRLVSIRKLGLETATRNFSKKLSIRTRGSPWSWATIVFICLFTGATSTLVFRAKNTTFIMTTVVFSKKYSRTSGDIGVTAK